MRKLFKFDRPPRQTKHRRGFGVRRDHHKFYMTEEEEREWIEKRKEKDLRQKKLFDQATKEMLNNARAE